VEAKGGQIQVRQNQGKGFITEGTEIGTLRTQRIREKQRKYPTLRKLELAPGNNLRAGLKPSDYIKS
jgi:hypothetical protein